ncbi:MAG: hypothetical protein FJ398_04705 [Verrucomicrobia bacterium]|nr:hypothetical protein [Verrucomicrobiota bacterium]
MQTLNRTHFFCFGLALLAAYGFAANVRGAGLSNVARPTITRQPAGQTVLEGTNVTFIVTASGTQPIRYQWRYNGNNITGATSASYSISRVQSSQTGNYSVVVSNAGRSVTSQNASLTVLQPVAFRVVQSFGGRGTANGLFEYPQGMGLAGNGELHVVDDTNRRVQVFDRETCAYKRQYADGLYYPNDVAIDRAGNAYVSEYGASIYAYAADGKAVRNFSTEPSGARPFPGGISIDPTSGNLVVAGAPTET